MKISVLAFGIAKDILGQSEIEMEMPVNASVKELKEILVQSYPAFGALNAFQIAINANYARDNEILNEKDEIVIIPPVSGG